MGERKVLCNRGCMEAAEFVLAKGDFIPVHNHPDVTVFCYLVKGKIRVKSYDIIEKKGDDYLIRLVDDTIASAGDHLSLTPTSRNIHSIEALEASIFVDVFTPPYASCDDIDCFDITPAASGEDLFIAKPVALQDAAIPYSF